MAPTLIPLDKPCATPCYKGISRVYSWVDPDPCMSTHAKKCRTQICGDLTHEFKSTCGFSKAHKYL
jgi:hypothetical protein